MQAMRAGAAAVVVDHEVYCPLPQIVVKDVKLALGVTSGFWRRGKSLGLVAVAGSNGKTTTTQMIATILKIRYGEHALATEGNLNNDIGVPLMLWRLRDYHETAVIETGMNHVGEMRYLSGLVQPTIAVVTNAQREHQEFCKVLKRQREKMAKYSEFCHQTVSRSFQLMIRAVRFGLRWLNMPM